jgi:thiamine-phosphate pyrophosphorylase
MQGNKLKRGLYVITEHLHLGFDGLVSKTERILQAGVSALQYRNKHADRTQKTTEAEVLKELCTRYRTVFIINDDLELAREIDADGIHLGIEDTACGKARESLGDRKIIGVSCYNDFNRAIDAVSHGADYIAFGSMFPTTTKPNARNASPDLIKDAKQRFSLPVVAIGGITPGNCQPLIDAGADLLAVISSVYMADDPAAVTKQFNRIMNG